MILLIFLVLSQYGLACKYGIILQTSIYNWIQNWNFWYLVHNYKSGKAMTEAWFNLLFKWRMFLACLFVGVDFVFKIEDDKFFYWNYWEVLREFDLYWKFMFTDKKNDEIRKNKRTYYPARFLFHSSYSFLNCWKTTKPMTLYSVFLRLSFWLY